MTNEELILKKLEDIEAQIAPLTRKARELKELKDDLVPLGNQAVNLLIKELQEVEAAFELDDLFLLIKQAMRSIKNLIFALKQLDNLIEFIRDVEPLLKSSVPQLIHYLDQLEQRGVFRVIKSMLDVRAKVAQAYDADDIDRIGDSFVALLGLAEKLAEPKAQAFLEKLAALPSQVDIDQAERTGAFRLLGAGFNGEVKEGLGVMLELTKAMGRMKTSSASSAPGSA